MGLSYSVFDMATEWTTDRWTTDEGRTDVGKHSITHIKFQVDTVYTYGHPLPASDTFAAKESRGLVTLIFDLLTFKSCHVSQVT